LHSSIVQSRQYQRTPAGKREAILMANVDSALALTVALFVNAAIVVVAAAVFYRSGHFEVAAIEDAYRLLSPLVGASAASTLFAVALLASGQNSSITGTLAGQVVMEGFIHIKLQPWLRRMITRSVAIIPTIIVVWFTGERGTEKLLLLSQVILSLQLSFAVVPLVIFTGSRAIMGEFVNSRLLQALSWIVAVLIAGLNAWFLVLMLN
jgi:manganese transport protein